MTHREHQDDDQETDLRTAPDKKREAESTVALPPARPRPWRWYGAILATLIVLGGGGWWLYQQLTHVVVTDARVAADIVAMSSRVPGWVTVLEVTDGDAAQRGRVLIQIDDRESRLRVEALDAQLAGIARRREEIEARIALTDRQTQSRITAKQAAVRAAEARLAAAAAQLDLARQENDRAEKLAPSGAINRARLDQTRAALETAKQQTLSAQADLENARAALAEAEAARGELTVLRTQLAELGPEEQRLRAQKAQAELDLEDRTIVMPFDGVVDRVFVDKGEYVTPGQRLLMVHDPERVRVEANVKETDIRFFRPGKSVMITVDALPGRRFEGRVTRVGQSATSEFALLPNPNPSGNFTKITQRLPVRIAVQQDGGELKPGMMVELEAKVSD
ncbi:membrane fusion protein (multidrug efflux system) [Marinobacter persicus]|jgi:membrane fusion protein (multidrug efflux system)|nr:membrane fusion protein (multidrug efflux system) [Marinobacter persicus]PPK57821.1 membrane fusion protein (multidrug efflux system) [Marinobacter persicus]